MEKLHSWWKTYVKNIRKDLVLMLLADLIFLLVMEIFLRNIPAPFPIFVKIGDLFVTLAISFLASFIFFLFKSTCLKPVKKRMYIRTWLHGLTVFLL